MNPAALEALDQARRYYVEGVVNSRKRVATLTRELEEAEGQLAHAEQKVADLEMALTEARGNEDAAADQSRHARA